MRMIRMMKSSSTSTSSSSSSTPTSTTNKLQPPSSTTTATTTSPTTSTNEGKTHTSSSSSKQNKNIIPMKSHSNYRPQPQQRHLNSQFPSTTISKEEMEVSWDAIAEPISIPRHSTIRSRTSRSDVVVGGGVAAIATMAATAAGSSSVVSRSHPNHHSRSHRTRINNNLNDDDDDKDNGLPTTHKSCLPIRGMGHSSHSLPPKSFTNRDSTAAATTRTNTNTHTATQRRVSPPPPPEHRHIRRIWSNDDEEEDDPTSEYIDWPGTQNVHGQTIPILNHDDDDDDWVVPAKTTTTSFCKEKDDTANINNRTMNTSATTNDSSFHSFIHPTLDAVDDVDVDAPDFFVGAFQAEQQTKLIFDPLVLQQPIPLKRSLDSLAGSRNGTGTRNKSLSFQIPPNHGVRATSSTTPTASNKMDDNNTHSNHTNNDNPHFMKGYRGFIEKTKDVPSLFDTTADSASEATTTTTTASPSKPIPTTRNDPPLRRLNDGHGRHDNNENWNGNNINNYNNYDTETYVSDVFDGISLFSTNDDDAKSISLQQYHQRDKLAHVPRVTYPQSIVEEDDDEDTNNMNHYVRDHYHTTNHTPSSSGSNTNTTFQLITIPGMGITTIQTSDTDYRNRYAASSTASHSDIGSYHTASTTMTPIPDVQKMLLAGHDHDSALHGIYGNIGQSKTKSTRNNNHGGNHHDQMVRPSKRSELNHPHMESDQNSSYSSSGSQYSVDDPSGLYVDGDYLSEYYIKPSIMKKVLLKYRSISDQCTMRASVAMSLEKYDLLVDERKAFALFEMRSRIMEKDIERQLERRGGSFVVDDIVTTPYHRKAHRIRDAVIVSKAWRDGATISDVIHTAWLTRRTEHSYTIPRRTQVLGGTTTESSSWELVRWLDDTDFIQYRCPSLGSRHMHGFEMFTIGDCQSILLKLTNERCNELRHELNIATEMQINAEDFMKEEESENNNVDGSLTEAEMTYLSALESVKTISKKLVAAEKSFALVRDRIRTLISRYETILLKIDAGSYAGASSIISYESSYYSEHDHKQYMKEERVWAKRAMRAEIRAEIAAREALLAKQQAAKLQAEKMREIEELRKKLDELQSENSVASGHEREKNALTNVMSQRYSNQSQSNQSGNIGREKIDGVKQRFRDRMAEKKRLTTAANIGSSSSLISSVHGRAPLYPTSSHPTNGTRRNVVPPSAQHQAKRELLWSAGEEMFQQMVFYERSLEAVVVDSNDTRTK